jgi:hypothetical protein
MNTSKVKVSRPAKSDQRGYSDTRSEMRTGDLLLFSGTSLLSRLIEGVTRATYSHVALVVSMDGRLLAFQADPGGVVVQPASKVVCRYDGKVDWWSMNEGVRGRLRERDTIDTALTLLGLRYGYMGSVVLGLRKLFGARLGCTDSNLLPRSLFCSEFVSMCLRNGGVDVVDGINDPSTTPTDIVSSRHFTRRCRLKDSSLGDACERLILPPSTSERRYRAVLWDGMTRRQPNSLLAG